MAGQGRSAVVVGAGISGLVCAYRLQQRGWSVRLVEASDRVGGVIRSERAEGFLCEAGPNSIREAPEIARLIGDLGLESERVTADARLPRFVFHRGKLHRVPLGPGTLVTSSLLSWRGKLRLLAEPWVEARRDGGEETLASFVRRRFGAEVLERLAGPFVSGVFAGDPARLSVRATFPILVELEERHGSILRGMRRQPVSSGASQRHATLTSFREGLESLPRALADRIGSSAIELGARAAAIARLADSTLQVTTVSARGELRLDGHAVILAVPAYAAAELVRPFAPSPARHLDAIPHPPIATLHLGFRESDLQRPLAGFGFLVPRTEPVRLLGCIWSSSLFPGRAPEGSVLVTVVFGGATDPEAASLPDSVLVETAARDLKSTLGIAAPPHVARLERIERAIPQYPPGHVARIDKIERQLASIPGLHLAGSYLRGISLGDCVAQAEALAKRIDEGEAARPVGSGA